MLEFKDLLVEPCLVRSCADTQHSLPFVFLLFEAEDYGPEGWERSRYTYMVSALILEHMYTRFHDCTSKANKFWVHTLPARRSRPTFVIKGNVMANRWTLFRSWPRASVSVMQFSISCSRFPGTSGILDHDLLVDQFVVVVVSGELSLCCKPRVVGDMRTMKPGGPLVSGLRTMHIRSYVSRNCRSVLSSFLWSGRQASHGRISVPARLDSMLSFSFFGISLSKLELNRLFDLRCPDALITV
jgi:hypothetical protein